jgi:hypothetical protein
MKRALLTTTIIASFGIVGVAQAAGDVAAGNSFRRRAPHATVRMAKESRRTRRWPAGPRLNKSRRCRTTNRARVPIPS